MSRGPQRLAHFLAKESLQQDGAVLRIRECDGNISHLLAVRGGFVYDSSSAGVAAPVPATAEGFAAMGVRGIVQMWQLVCTPLTTTKKPRKKQKLERRWNADNERRGRRAAGKCDSVTLYNKI